MRRHIREAIKSGPIPKIRKWRSLPIAKLTRAERNMAFVERHLIVPEGSHVGKPIKLADFQEVFFYSVYDNSAVTTDAYLSIARKNSKTATIACIALIHLVGPEAELNSEIMSGARSRDQAAQVFRYASKMVQMSPTLSNIVRIVPSAKKLIGLPRNVEYRAGAAEAATSHGGSPIVAILDELGQVKGPRDDYVDAIITSQGAHDNPLLIGISTQAPTDADLWSVWLDDAAKEKPDNVVCHLYETPANEDIAKRSGWIKSNPALGLFRSEKDMKRMADRAKRMPTAENTFRNLYLNQRISSVSPFVSESVWKSCGAYPAEMDGVEIYCGLDLSSKTDLTAFIAVWKESGVWQVFAQFYAPEEGVRDRAKRDRVPYDLWADEGYIMLTPGATVDYNWVAQHIGQVIGDNLVKGLAFDRWRMDLMQKELADEGIDIPMIAFGQGYKDMGPALDTLEAELLNRRIAHGNNPVLTMCAANAVASKDPAGNRKLDKSKANGRIDGMVALAMALGAAQKEEPDDGPSVYEQRGVLEL